MTADTADAAGEGKKSFSQKMLDGIERLGNKVPHPVMMFLYLIIIVIVLSQILYMLGVSVTEEIAVPVETGGTDYYPDSTQPGHIYPEEPYEADFEIVEQTIGIRSLLSIEGIRFIFTSFVSNFAGFSVVAVILVAMIGVGVAEESGMMGALIRKTVKVTPRRLITFILIFVGVLSSVATDAGYLILIPLGAAAFISLGRHPLAGIAAAFGGVSAVFAVNILIAPLDAMLTEITNEAIILAGGEPITVVANFYFATASTIIMSLVATFVTVGIIEPRLGKYTPAEGETIEAAESSPEAAAAESRGLRFALYGLLGMIALVTLLTAPPGAPLRDPQTGAIIGNTPFMSSLIFIITLIFLVAGIGYGYGAKTFSSSADIIRGVTKAYAGLAGLIFMLLMISQFIAFFNYSNLPQVIAIWMAGALEQMSIGTLPLMVGFILVIMILNIIIPNSVPKWAIFAPIFIPVFMRLDVSPQAILAAYRVGDSPLNVITPLMVYLPFVLTIVQRYQKDAGIGTVVALMLPYSIFIAVAWILLFIIWFLLGLPLGPGFPVSI